MERTSLLTEEAEDRAEQKEMANPFILDFAASHHLGREGKRPFCCRQSDQKPVVITSGTVTANGTAQWSGKGQGTSSQDKTEDNQT